MTDDPSGRPAAGRRLCDIYDVALLDLDGVVYLGSDPISGAAGYLGQARDNGMRLAYVTNNASRRAGEVAELLSGMGVPATADDVVTSGQAAAALLRRRLSPGSAVLVVGSEALAGEVAAVGLSPVRSADPLPAAVVQGYVAETSWRDLAEATIAVRGGAWWVATNTDSTLPSARGPLPGNGALVAAVGLATGKTPEVVGKPYPQLHSESVRRTGARRPLVVGDRLDTDVQGAVTAGADSLLVLTGVATPAETLAAPRHQQPSYLAEDLRGLLEKHVPVVADRGRAQCGGFGVRTVDDRLVLHGSGTERVDALRALCAVTWPGAPHSGPILAEGAAATAALAALGLDPETVPA